MDETELKLLAARWVGFKDLFYIVAEDRETFGEDAAHSQESLELIGQDLWNAQEDLYRGLKKWIKE